MNRQNPRELATKVAEDFPSNSCLEKIEVAGHRFMNLTLSNEWIEKEVSKIYGQKLWFDTA